MTRKMELDYKRSYVVGVAVKIDSMSEILASGILPAMSDRPPTDYRINGVAVTRGKRANLNSGVSAGKSYLRIGA